MDRFASLRARALLADNRQMVGKLMVIAALMFGFGYALVPIYRAVCNALGINVLSVSELRTGAGPAAARNGQVDTGRTVTVEFDANVRGPWDFRPERASIDVHPGQLTTVMYDFRNRQDKAIAVQAIPSYAPAAAMAHFNKVECFCFSQHLLQAGEAVRWPVVFVVDAQLPKDVRTITLSYTFFEVGGKVPAEPAQAARGHAAEPLS
ncbi:MAG: cytochrome c oxidase assembly protein [Pseudomonadota bacterium]|nr:cytochrome c oxidase assembly protein [Pseudomonadota bacterium]